jgi:hypothetical protein
MAARATVENNSENNGELLEAGSAWREHPKANGERDGMAAGLALT